jgi:hypothetical protein
MRFAVVLVILNGAVNLGKNGIRVLVTLGVWALCPRSLATVMLPRLVEMLFANPTRYCMNIELRLVLFVSPLFGLAFREWTSAHAIS